MALTFRIVTSGNRAAIRMNTSTDPSFFTFDEVVKFDSPVKACWAAISSFNFDFPKIKEADGTNRNITTESIGVGLICRVLDEDPNAVLVHNSIYLESKEMLDHALKPSGSIDYIVFAEI
ncbi:hypothetical protein YSY43_41280 [Paenibacillus sp. YSY-4.3]